MPQPPPDALVAKATATLMAELSERLDQLNSNIKAASASSERLARALNWLTGIGAAVALLGVLVAAIEIVHRWPASGG
jgi:beta-phosphoglucomutase-like phosphatase (HAD superfamily)